MKSVATATLISKMRYCLGIFGIVKTNISQPQCKMMHDLQVVLNNMMRLILNKRVADKIRIEELCERTGITSVNRMVAEEHARIVWQAKNNPQSPLSELFQVVMGGATRASARGDLCSTARTSLGIRNVPHTAITTWNSTGDSLRAANSSQSFKLLTRTFVETIPLK